MGEVSTPTPIVQFYKSQENKHMIRKEGNMTTDVTEHEKALCRGWSGGQRLCLPRIHRALDLIPGTDLNERGRGEIHALLCA